MPYDQKRVVEALRAFEAGEIVVVMGLGLIGLLTVQILRANGCRVIGFDPNRERAALATQLGADVAVSGSFTAAPSGIFPAALTGLDPASPAAAGTFTLYVVDGTRALLIETDTIGLTLGNLQNAM